jgi:phytoene dehydrogenase-like protein
VVGAGPNGLAAAIVLARAGWEVTVYEAGDTVGGGVRSAELTLPGFTHDICSAVYPLGIGSPFFRSLPLAEHGLDWVHPPALLAHPFDDGAAATLHQDLEATAAPMSERDAGAYRRAIGRLSARWDRLAGEVLAPPLHLPRYPFTLARFGLAAPQKAGASARRLFEGERTRALFAGIAAHSNLPLDRRPSAGFALTLAIAGHAVGWPLAKGGAQQLAEALTGYLRRLGGSVETGRPVDRLSELPATEAYVCDVTAGQLAALARDWLATGYRRRLERFRYGPGVFKIDWALSAPIPWQSPACAQAGTLHLGGPLGEIERSERAVWQGMPSDPPFVLLTQPTRFDASRAPNGQHTAWAYCHVPNGCETDMTEAIERQVERFAPGFRDRILARHTMTAPDLMAHNPNCVGGDISGGVMSVMQMVRRPTLSPSPYRTAHPRVWLCSASTPPGGAVHGMGGYHAAQDVLKRLGAAEG